LKNPLPSQLLSSPAQKQGRDDKEKREGYKRELFYGNYCFTDCAESLVSAGMNSIDELFDPYIKLEKAILARISEWINQHCGLCTACCCRADICEEALQSAFLSKLLIKQGLDETELDDSYGWLTPQGCVLAYGRPPICHAYFCDSLLERLENNPTRHAMTVLGLLLYHVGEKALGDLHLTEIEEADALQKIDLQRVARQLAEAQQAFSAIDEFFQTNGRPSPAARNAMERIPLYEL
jgi:hypothetical protein